MDGLPHHPTLTDPLAHSSGGAESPVLLLPSPFHNTLPGRGLVATHQDEISNPSPLDAPAGLNTPPGNESVVSKSDLASIPPLPSLQRVSELYIYSSGLVPWLGYLSYKITPISAFSCFHRSSRAPAGPALFPRGTTGLWCPRERSTLQGSREDLAIIQCIARGLLTARPPHS